MHDAPMDESKGTLSRALLCQINCPKCGNHHGNILQYWKSNDEACEDEKHTCGRCGNVWWVEGNDS